MHSNLSERDCVSIGTGILFMVYYSFSGEKKQGLTQKDLGGERTASIGVIWKNLEPSVMEDIHQLPYSPHKSQGLKSSKSC